MELVEKVKDINSWLKRDFGQTYDGRPSWRVVWANDQLEKRKVEYTDEGFELIYPEVREVRKYKHIKDRFVLERLVPVVGETDLITKDSYEPAWTFQDRFEQYLPPRFDACKYVIEAIYSQMDKAGTHTKYKDPNESPEQRLQKIIDMEHKLFGNETPVGDALCHGYGVTVPEMPKSEVTMSVDKVIELIKGANHV